MTSCLTALAVALFAGGYGQISAAQAAQGPSQTFDVRIEGFEFRPGTLNIQVNDSVRWTNEDGAPHTATSDTGVFDSGIIGTFAFTFTTAGEFPYHCTEHPSMKGKIIVGSGQSSTSTATATSVSQPSATSTAPPSCGVFSDVAANSTFEPFVRCLACRNILGGYADGTFRPNASITRGQLSKIVANAASLDDTPSGQSFSDVPPGHDFYLFVERMATNGIIGGYSDGTFRPGNPATRGQIAKIVSNAKGYNDPPTGQSFTDVSPNHGFYPFIERMATRGIIGGYSDGTFRPNNDATRGQVSKIVANAFFPECNP